MDEVIFAQTPKYKRLKRDKEWGQAHPFALNPKRNMQKILTLKYMRGPHGPQKHNGMTWKICKAGNKVEHGFSG